jgi:hypothetical protein
LLQLGGSNYAACFAFSLSVFFLYLLILIHPSIALPYLGFLVLLLYGEREGGRGNPACRLPYQSFLHILRGERERNQNTRLWSDFFLGSGSRIGSSIHTTGIQSSLFFSS